MNFFAWIREGVRQAVLMGVSDAVENIGTPPSGDDFRQRLGDALRPSATDAGSARLSGGQPRKKLGRSLEDIQAAAQKAGS